MQWPKEKIQKDKQSLPKRLQKKKIEQQEHRKKPGMNSGVPEGLAVTWHKMHPNILSFLYQ
jgi:hypothetical protein